jgi:protein-disulfide isomerase
MDPKENQLPGSEINNAQNLPDDWSDNTSNDTPGVDIDVQPEQPKQNSNQLMIPIAIVIAGAMITAGIIFTGGQAPAAGLNANAEADFGNSLSASAANIRLPEKGEHVRGNPNAPITIIEFSDFQCPFCERIHPTLDRILNEYDGQVKWIYRHFPLASIHPEATKSAVASECIAELAGNDAFWEFVGDMFENQSRLGDHLYAELATSFGVKEKDFTACMSSKESADKVMEDLIDATKSGGQGTPYVIVLDKKGRPFPFSGALPYEQIKMVVEQALASK